MGDRRLARRALATGTAAALMLVGAAVIAPAAMAYTACATPATPLPDAKKILITGDSATNMSTGDYTWRYFLWQHFAAHSTPVDFQGTFDGTFDYVGGSNLNSHDYAGCDFDWDHEARAGNRLADYNEPRPTDSDPMTADYPAATSWIRGAVAKYSPDVVIEFAGYNDLFHYEEDRGLPSNSVSSAAVAAAIVEEAHQYVLSVQAVNSSTDVLLANVPASGVNRYSAYSNALKTAAATWSVGASKVQIVELPSWTGHSWDGWHPDAVGDAIIGTAFAKAFRTLDPATYPAAGSPPVPAIGPRTVATITSVTKPADGQVALSWTMSPNADRTVVRVRDLTTGGPWVDHDDLVTLRYFSDPAFGTSGCGLAPCTSFTVKNLLGMHLYEFRLRSGKGYALATDIESESVTATVTGAPPPPPPAKAGQVNGPALVSLEHSLGASWAPVAGASGYRVRWRKHGTGGWLTAPVAGTAKTITGLPPGVVYDVEVQATKTGALDGDFSVTRSAKTKAYKLAGPAKPRMARAAGHKLRATWAAVPKASRYLVELRLGAKRVKAVFVTRRTWTSGALVAGKTYTVRVRPYDGAYGGGTSPAGSIKVK
jgi:hypothetical protein